MWKPCGPVLTTDRDRKRGMRGMEQETHSCLSATESPSSLFRPVLRRAGGQTESQCGHSVSPLLLQHSPFPLVHFS